MILLSYVVLVHQVPTLIYYVIYDYQVNQNVSKISTYLLAPITYARV